MSKEKHTQGPDLEMKARIIGKYGSQRRFALAANIPECEVSNYLNRVKDWKPEHQKRAAECLNE